MTSLIAADGSGRSASFIPAVPAAASRDKIAFIQHLAAVGAAVPAGAPARMPIEECFVPCGRALSNARHSLSPVMATGDYVFTWRDATSARADRSCGSA